MNADWSGIEQKEQTYDTNKTYFKTEIHAQYEPPDEMLFGIEPIQHTWHFLSRTLFSESLSKIQPAEFGTSCTSSNY